MIPWYGVVGICVGFSIWTLVCFLVGAAVKDTVIKKQQEQQKPNVSRN